MKVESKVNEVSYLLCDECSVELECCSKCGLPFIASEEIICDATEHYCKSCSDALHENEDNNSHPSIKRNKNEARDDASPTQDADHENTGVKDGK